jgi:phage terminase large subunit-like protein
MIRSSACPTWWPDQPGPSRRSTATPPSYTTAWDTTYDFVAARVIEIAQLHDVKAVAYDRHLIHRFSDELDEAGVTLPLMDHPQGWEARKDNLLRMPQSITDLEDAILESRIRIKPNPVLTWNVMSATFLESPAGLRRFTKQRATGRIDGAIALAQAVGAATIKQEAGDALDDFLAGPVMA